MKVLDDNGGGTLSDIVDGINWAIGDHNTRNQNASEPIPAVANLSLGALTSDTTLDVAVESLISGGIVTVVAAGNRFWTPTGFHPVDVSGVSPARVANAITVGSTDTNDVFASTSSFGGGVDILAPGVSVISAGNSSDTASNTLSGTSMATPHVAGVAALLLQDEPELTHLQVRNKIVSTNTGGKITGFLDDPNVSWDDTRDDTPNRLLYFPQSNGSPVAKPTGVWLEIDQPNGQVNLFWTDASDNEIKFQIERSADLVNYQVVAEPFANQESYSEPISSGGFFYRIRAVGQGGTASLFATPGPQPNPGSQTLSGTAYAGDYLYETLDVTVPSGTTATGSVSVDVIADYDGYAYAEAYIYGPNNTEAYAYAEVTDSYYDSDSDSFSNGPPGVYTLEILYEADNLYYPDASQATATATLSWQ